MTVRFHPGMEHTDRLEEPSEGFPSEAALTAADKKLMRLAKDRVFFNNLTKMLVMIYIVANAFLIGIWLLSGGGYFWPVWVLAGWGTGLIIFRTVINTVVIPPYGENHRIAAEYRKLREAMRLDE
jgi:hypothetical protein